MKVLIVEKPSMKAKYEQALKDEKNLVVVNSVGHIEELVPLENYLADKFKGKDKIYWSDLLPELPFIPEKFFHRITNQKVFAEIIRHLKNAEEIILGCDPDREGELIHRNIVEIAKDSGMLKASTITRIWLHSETAPEIQKSYKNRKNYLDYDGYYQAARAREIVDWLIGIQLTILYSVRYGQPGKPISIGRVQSWLLSEIVKRWSDFNNFVPKKFWTISFLSAENLIFNLVDEEKNIRKIFDEKKALEIFKKLENKTLQVTSVEKKKFTESAPKLYDLKSLQKDAARIYKFSPDDTLAIAQNLYEKYDLISYPRTDCDVLSPEEAKELKNAMNLVYKFDQYKELVFAVKKHNPELVLDKKYIGKLEGHYAIIPVLSYDKSAVPNLPEKEAKIFDLIVKRLIAALLPPAKGEKTEITAVAEDELFVTRFKNYTDYGYKAYLEKKEDKKDDSEEPEEALKENIKIKKNDILIGDFEIKEDETKPEPLFNDTRILQLMEKAHLLIEDEELRKALKEANGIGTAATRASFIPLLIKRGYIVKEKNEYIPTEIGNSLYAILPDELKIPDFSAKLEYELSQFIKKTSTKTVDDIINETSKFLSDVFNKIKHTSVYAMREPKGNKPLSEKQTALIQKHGDSEVKSNFEKGEFDLCRKWIDSYFASLRSKK